MKYARMAIASYVRFARALGDGAGSLDGTSGLGEGLEPVMHFLLVRKMELGLKAGDGRESQRLHRTLPQRRERFGVGVLRFLPDVDETGGPAATPLGETAKANCPAIDSQRECSCHYWHEIYRL